MNGFHRAHSVGALLIALVLVATSAAAQDIVPAPRPDSDSGVTVEAEALRLNESDRIAIFTGDVVASQGALSLRSEEMHVRYGDTTGTGDEGPEIERIDAKGGVIIILNGDEIRGDEATYDIVAQTFEATGDVVLIRDGNRVRGQRFVANLGTGESEMVGRVTVEFNPGSAGTSGSDQ